MLENKEIKTQKNKIEVEAPTVEEAIIKALKMLSMDKEDVIVEVLKEEKKGLFGMQGASPAKIRVTTKPIN